MGWRKAKFDQGQTWLFVTPVLAVPQIRIYPEAMTSAGLKGKVKFSEKSELISPVKTALAPIPKATKKDEDECPLYILVTTYLGYLMLSIFGHIRDFFGKIFSPQDFRHLKVYNVSHRAYVRIICLFFVFICRASLH